MLLVGTAVSGVEGLRLKTAKEDVGLSGGEELLDFDQMPDRADMDFYAQTRGREADQAVVACATANLPTDTAWKALNTKTLKTPSNYCHQQKTVAWFCWGGECMDTSNVAAGACKGSDQDGGKKEWKCTAADNAQCCEDDHIGNQVDIDDCKTGGARTEEGWWWNMLPYDKNFGCVTTHDEDSCKGPYPSLSCNSRGKTAREAVGKMARDRSTSFCWGKWTNKAGTKFYGTCYDVMQDADVCKYAPGGAGGPLSRGTKTDDGWTLRDQGYDVGVGCQLNSMNPIIKSALNAFNGEDAASGTVGVAVELFFEPARQLYMEIYPLRNEFTGWMNVKQKTGFMIDTLRIGNLQHKRN